jgi:Zn-dependent M32 family carboxypeptidase
MTKVKHSITLSKELSELVAFLASAKQMNLSEYFETRLRMVPEIQKQITQFENLPEDPIIDMSKIKRKITNQGNTQDEFRKLEKHLA